MALPFADLTTCPACTQPNVCVEGVARGHLAPCGNVCSNGMGRAVGRMELRAAAGEVHEVVEATGAVRCARCERKPGLWARIAARPRSVLDNFRKSR